MRLIFRFAESLPDNPANQFSDLPESPENRFAGLPPPRRGGKPNQQTRQAGKP